MLLLLGKSCPILRDPMDCSPPSSSVHEIIHAKYWSGLPFPPLGDLPDSGMEPTSPSSPALADEFFTTSATYFRSLWSLSIFVRQKKILNFCQYCLEIHLKKCICGFHLQYIK